MLDRVGRVPKSDKAHQSRKDRKVTITEQNQRAKTAFSDLLGFLFDRYVDFASYLRRLRDPRFPKFYAYEFALILCEDRDGTLLSLDQV